MSSVVFDILAKDNASKVFNKVADSADKSSGRIGGAFSKLGKGLVGAVAGFAAVDMFKGFITEAEESRKVGRLTEQVIKSTGGAAKVTAGQVGALATAISNKTGVDDEAIQSGSNLLLTFTGIRNEVGKGNDIFNRATGIITDMSVALGTDVKASAIQVGKALNDPIRGVTALSKVGVSFTQQQKDQIKTLVESGHSLDAQKIILKELGTEFGGAAAAAATPSQKLAVIFGNLKESIGTALLPVVDKAATFLGDRLIPALSKVGAIGRQVFDVLFKGDFKGGFFAEDSKVVDVLFRIRDAFLNIVAAVRTNFVPVMVKAFNALKGPAESLFGFFQAHARPIIIGLIAAIGLITAPVTTVAAGLVLLYSKSQTFRDVLAGVADFISTRVVPAFVSIGQFITTSVVPALTRVGNFLVSTFTPTFRALGDFITQNVVPAFQGLAARIRDNQPMFEKIARVIGVVAAVVGYLVAKIAGFLLPILVKLAAFLFTTLFAAIGVAIGIIARFVAVIGRIISIVGTVVGFVRDHWKLLLGILTGPIGAAVVFITSHFDTIVKTVKGIPGKISSAASGMFDGIKNAFRSAINWIIDAWNGLQFKIPGFDPPGPGPKFGGFTLGVPDIPRLAKGGITTGPTIAMIGDNPGGREAVIPLPTNGRLGGGDTYFIDARGATADAAPEIVKALRRYKRELGGDDLGIA